MIEDVGMRLGIIVLCLWVPVMLALWAIILALGEIRKEIEKLKPK